MGVRNRPSIQELYVRLTSLFTTAVFITVIVSFFFTGPFKDKERTSVRAAHAEKSEIITVASASTPAVADDEPESFAPTPATAPAPVMSSNYADVCAQFDPVTYPEQADDILKYASGTTGTPYEVLGSVWRNETGRVEGSDLASGNCLVVPELERRDRAKGTSHLEAMRRMGEAFGWNVDTLMCSCPSKDPDTGLVHGFGGCCGPFQFSGAEVVDKYAWKYGIGPLTCCGGALIAGWELKSHHDQALKTRTSDDYKAWGWAIRRYLGGADNPCQYDAAGNYKGGCKYLNKAITNWSMFYGWHSQGEDALRRNVAQLVARNMAALEKKRRAHGIVRN